MGLIDVIKIQVDRFDSQEMGIISSPVYRRYDQDIDAWVWVVDVDLEVARSNPNADSPNTVVGVAIDDPSREVYSADIGTQVKLTRRRSDNRYVATGLSRYKTGQLSVCLVQLSPCGTVIEDIGLPVLAGNTYRVLNYSELGDPLLNGGFLYGELPYGTQGKFDINGVLIKLN